MSETSRIRKREQLRAWRARNPDRVSAHNKSQREYSANWIRAKRVLRGDEMRADQRKRYAANPAPAKRRAKEWNKDHPGLIRSLIAKRRAALLQRTPRWLTAEDYRIIRGQYEMAALMTKLVGVPYHVDHIVPLQGENVSGLHVAANLRVIRGSENMKKGNTWLT